MTFDDGYKDNYDILFPIIKKYELPVSLFITVGNVGSSESFWWDQIAYIIIKTFEVDLDLNSWSLGNYKLRSTAEKKTAVYRIFNDIRKFDSHQKKLFIENLKLRLGSNFRPAKDREVINWTELKVMSDYGVAVGAHGMTHTTLSQLSRPKVKWEICESKKILQHKLHQNVKFFSFPNGEPNDLNNPVLQTLERAGFLAVCTWMKGYNKPDSSEDILILKRMAVSEGMCTGIFGNFSKSLFATELSGLFDVLMLRRLRNKR